MRTPISVKNELWHYLRRDDAASDCLAIFVHGYNGNYLSTWGSLSSLLERHADYDADLSKWDYLFIGFDTGVIETYLDVANIIRSRVLAAHAGKYPFTARQYRRFVLLGHSLGTLGIRQFLCMDDGMPRNWRAAIRGLCLICPVDDGSALAPLGWRFQRNEIAKALEIGNPQLRMLRAWYAGVLCTHSPPPTTVLIAQGERVATQIFGEWPGDPKATPISFARASWKIWIVRELHRVAEHIEAAKVDAWNASTVIGTIRDTLREAAA